MSDIEYWKECISIAADECDTPLVMTEKQLEYIARSVSSGHEHYDMAFYSPPASDRLNEIEREWKRKYDELEEEFAKYKGNAETAVKIALRQHFDAQVTIGEHGKVLRHDGRTTQIQ